MSHRNFKWPALLAATLACSLVACSDNDSNDAPPPPPPPPPPSGLGDTFGVTASKLISFDRANPAIIRTIAPIGGLAFGETLLGADFRPADAALYALTSNGRIVTIDIHTASLTPKSTLVADVADTGADGTPAFTGLQGSSFGFDFNPVPDRLRVVSDTGQNLRINVDTGATTTDGTINPLPKTIGAVAYTKSFKQTCRTVLYTIDAASDTLFRQDPPNNGTQVAVGPLGVDVNAVGGFDILGADDTAIAALSSNGSFTLYTINLGTGAATSVGTLNLPVGETLIGLASPTPATSPAQAPGELLGLTAGNKLVTFNRALPGKLCTSAAVTGLDAADSLVGIDVRPADGSAYALANTGRLYTVNPVTGAATLKSTLTADAVNDPTPDFLALDGSNFGLDFNPVPDRLRVVSNSGQNLRINVDTGATITDGTLKTEGATRTGVTAAAYTNSVAGAAATTLYYLDSDADKLLVTSAPNDGVVTEVGSLGADIGEINGFDIDASNNVALIAVTSGVTSTLNTLNLATGAVSAPLGTIGGGEVLRGLTLLTARAATVFGVTESGTLVSFKPTQPDVVTTIGALTGISVGETILGLDYRPANGKLYAFGSSGRLYTVNEATGAATLASTLAAAADDLSNPFVAQNGAAFGIDFNPVPDRLRIVSDTGQNLRINVDSGATTTDAALSNPAADIFAAAYTNSFASPTGTALYAIDAVTDSLVLIGTNPAVAGDCPDAVGNPNCGVVTPVGPLGVDVAAFGDLDIAGGTNGLALAALRPAAGGASALYRINLLTGVATKVGDIATPGNSALRGIAIQVK